MMTTEMDTLLGRLVLVANDAGLVAVHLPTSRYPLLGIAKAEHSPRAEAILLAACTQLTEYFAGARYTFDVPLALEGTPFQRAVWAALGEIPYSETRSYGDVARRVGSAPRAVGNANGRNPVALIVPCHRVVGAQGALVGYGGGLSVKAWLLAHEAQSLSENLRPSDWG
jgi:methylated-DNA-[protein]-cysteine S-methyltransferase